MQEVAQYPLGQSIPSTESASDGLLGAETYFPDLDYNASGVKPTLSGCMVHARLMKNAGTAVNAGTLVKWSAAPTEFNGLAGSGEQACGVVDPYIGGGTGTVAQNAKCWVIFYGPCDVTSSAAFSANAHLKTAASGKAVTSTNSDATDIGVAIEAATAGDQLKRAFIDIMNR